MPAKKSGRSGGGKRPPIVAAPGSSIQGVLPGLEFRSPLLGPDPAVSEEMMFDLMQLTSSRLYGSLDEVNAEIKRLTEAGPIPRSEPLESRARAQRLVYDAWGSSVGSGRPLARHALVLDPDCVDAHLYLTVHAEEAEQVLKGAFQAVEAGARWLEREKDNVPDDGQLWAYLPARPYLRARQFLARCLWTTGGRIAAGTLLDGSLELDEGDGLGSRYLLLGWYLDMGEEMFSHTLLTRYKKERSTIFLYADALLTFWERGDDKTATNRLKQALKANPHVPELLLFDPPDPTEVLEIDAYQPGSEEEAAICAFLLDAGWERDQEAMAWLEEVASPAT